MTIAATLQRIAAGFLQARQETFAKHPMADFIRDEAPLPFEAYLKTAFPTSDFLVVGSPGQGNWADVPWIGVFLPAVTESATRGYYVVYLFSADMARCYLSLAQGTTAVREEFRSNEATHAELLRRSALIRARIPEFKPAFSKGPALLGGQTRLAKDYEPSVAFCAEYEIANLPDEGILKAQLASMVTHYAQLFARGGIGALEENGPEESAGAEKSANFIERRRYRQHETIERNPKIAKEAKKHHGCKCQGCGFDFGAVYGAFGEGYIEAHHLTPISQLPENVPVHLDPKTDFAVLCANCHRMMHRNGGPKSVDELKVISGVIGLTRFLSGGLK